MDVRNHLLPHGADPPGVIGFNTSWKETTLIQYLLAASPDFPTETDMVPLELAPGPGHWTTEGPLVIQPPPGNLGTKIRRSAVDS